MLTVNYCDDECLIKSLFEKLEIHDEPDSGIIALLIKEEIPVGICKMILNDTGCEIVNFKIDKANDDFMTTDFFFRTVLFKLSRTDINVLIKGNDERLKKFGFQPNGEYMIVSAKDIQFPSSCGGHHAEK